MSSAAIAERHVGRPVPVSALERARRCTPCEVPGNADLFMPDEESPAASDTAQRVAVRTAWAAAVELCRACPKHTDGSCLDNEVRMMRAGYRTFGVVGATTPGQRRALLTASELNRLPEYLLEPCGTLGAHIRHKRAGEEPCTPCKEAYNLSRSATRPPRPVVDGRRLILGPMRRLRAAAYVESCRLRTIPVLEEARTA